MTTLELYRKHKAGEVGRDRFLYEVRRDKNLPWVTNITSYDDAVKILKNKGIISEADANIATAPEVDRVNPYFLKKGVEKLLSKEEELTNDSYIKALNKAAKQLHKNPHAFDKDMFANVDDVDKADAKLETQEVKKANHKDKANEMKKAKVKALKEQAINELTDHLKKKELSELETSQEDILSLVGGLPHKKESGEDYEKITITEPLDDKFKDPIIKKFIDLGWDAKPNNAGGITAVKKTYFISDKMINEDSHWKYHVGSEVQTPDGPGKVTEIIGSTFTVEMEDGSLRDYQTNTVHHFTEKEKEEEPVQQSQTEPSVKDMWANWDKEKHKTFGGMVVDPGYQSDLDKKYGKLKEYIAKNKHDKEKMGKLKKAIKEKVDAIKGKNTTTGEEELLAIVPGGQGTKTAQALKAKGATSVIVKSIA